jgi:hypothetical protein
MFLIRGRYTTIFLTRIHGTVEEEKTRDPWALQDFALQDFLVSVLNRLARK